MGRDTSAPGERRRSLGSLRTKSNCEDSRFPRGLVGTRDLLSANSRNAIVSSASSFPAAKAQVDRDLGELKFDYNYVLRNVQARAALDAVGRDLQQALISLLELIQRTLDTAVDEFKLHVTETVERLEEQRRGCGSKDVKVLYTRLLLILTRCSRLLITEQQALNPMGSFPLTSGRSRRWSVVGPGIYRLGPGNFLPPEPPLLEAESDAKSALQRSHTVPVSTMTELAAQLQAAERRGRAEVPQGRLSMENVAEHGSESGSYRQSTGGSSTASGSGKKSKGSSGVFKRLTRGLANTFKDLRKKMQVTKLQKQLHCSPFPRGHPLASPPLTSPPCSSQPSTSSPQVGAARSFLKNPTHSPSYQMPQSASFSVPITPTHSLTPAPSQRVRFQDDSAFHSSSTDAFLRMRVVPLLPKRSTDDQLQEDGYSDNGDSALEPIQVVCRICEQRWAPDALEEHSEVCTRIRKMGQGFGVDAQLTMLARTIEDECHKQRFPFQMRPDLRQLVHLARNAASFQPDGSKVPHQRCLAAYYDVQKLAYQAGPWRTNPVTLTYALRIAELASEKVVLLRESLAETRSGRNSENGSYGSGTSTPRASQAMTIDEYEIIKPISRGAFGRVYLARKKATGDLHAIKVMKKKDLVRKNMVESVTNERNILAMANNPFVVRFYYSFTSKENLYIVMEYISGGDCYSLLRSMGALDEEVARQYIAETVLALEYCHAQGIIHRDLKPDNMLISAQGHVKLTDFGLSCVGVNDQADVLAPPVSAPAPMGVAIPEDIVSEPSYSDPNNNATPSAAADLPSPQSNMDWRFADSAWSEATPTPHRRSHPGTITASTSAASIATPGGVSGFVSGRDSGGPSGMVSNMEIDPPAARGRAVGTPDYLAPEVLMGWGHGPEVDWWSLGAILYELITGVPPFNADTPEAIFDNILDRSIKWPEDDETMSPACKDLIDKLLEPNPAKRLGHRGAGEVKLHPFFADVDWTSLARSKAAFIPAVENELDTSYFHPKPVSRRSMAEDLWGGASASPCGSAAAPPSRGYTSEPGSRLNIGADLTSAQSLPSTYSNLGRVASGSLCNGSNSRGSGSPTRMSPQQMLNNQDETDHPDHDHTSSEEEDVDVTSSMQEFFDNFSYTNLDSLNVANREKMEKLREQYGHGNGTSRLHRATVDLGSDVYTHVTPWDHEGPPTTSSRHPRTTR